MHLSKALDPDGLHVGFYKKYWSVGKEVTNLALKFLSEGGTMKEINKTFIVLITKVKNTNSYSDFKPIRLCNIIYKIVAKILANRLKSELPNIISEAQSGFVPNILIKDNGIIVFEDFHWLQKPRRDAENFMSIKLDMSKAYDRVDGVF